jgi:leader peptidase (prepilin peptidase) / N-methyltransferase
MIRVLATVFAGLLGLAFGSFLNVCLTRWPEGESILTPRSHCRSCNRSLNWWENLPVASWLALGGRCQSCGARIGWRYPLVELAVGALWALIGWRFLDLCELSRLPEHALVGRAAAAAGQSAFCLLLVALAVLDAEHFWLPDRLTWPGMALGVADRLLFAPQGARFGLFGWGNNPSLKAAIATLGSMLVAAGVIVIIGSTYKLIRKRRGIGRGDAKLMALLAAWLGLAGALFAFGLGVVLGAIVALVALLIPSPRRGETDWAQQKLPLGTFLCAGGIVSWLWGAPLIAAYRRWAGF